MKTQYIKLSLIALIGLAFACSTDDNNILAIPKVPDSGTGGGLPTPTYTSGSADFSSYVAIGNSITSGFADAALYIKGQEASFPNILATQFQLAGGGSFSQPLMSDDLGGLLLGGNQITPNRFIFDPVNQLPFTISGTPTTEVSSILPGPFNNMGVPFAKSFHLQADGYGNVAGVAGGQANPFFARMASTPNASVLEDVLAQAPSFFTLWLGSNDVLAYALAGGAGEDHNETMNTDAASYGSTDITNANVFAQVFGGILQAISQTGANGVVVNLPNVMQAPYFHVVPYNPIPLDAGTAAAVNDAYSDYNNAGLLLAEGGMLISSEERAARTINFEASATNAVVIEDEDLTDLSALGLPPLRQTTADDLMVLTSQFVIGTLADPNNPLSVNGVGVALDDGQVLTPEEQTAIADATALFNATIEMMSTQFDYGFLDANALVDELTTSGINIGGDAMITADFVTGGAYSLDGVHPSPRGNAVIANEILEVINTKYGANLPEVDPIEFTGLYVN
ncbi:MAG: G-D-S-L family lipolytic protein [Eudoraea sp.]|nr:G-D-S-L family lipolytic protein [Eudoraea sp.]